MNFQPYGSPAEQSVFPQPTWDVAYGDAGKSLGFIADSAAFPNGIELHFIDQDGSGTSMDGHDLAISAMPGNFSSELVRGTQLGASSAAGFLLRFGPEQPGEPFFGRPTPSQDVALTPGGRYYLNWRAANRGTTHGQFWWKARTGSATVGAPTPITPPVPGPIPLPVAGPLHITIPAGATYIEIG